VQHAASEKASSFPSLQFAVSVAVVVHPQSLLAHPPAKHQIQKCDTNRDGNNAKLSPINMAKSIVSKENLFCLWISHSGTHSLFEHSSKACSAKLECKIGP
jgi:hypothetical protein